MHESDLETLRADPTAQNNGQITFAINACAFKVQNLLGCGFLEKVYENALAWELVQAGLSVRQQVPYRIRYGEIVAGEYVADLVVEDRVVVEVKACDALAPVHKAQAINYLKASGMATGLLINFGHARLQIRRVYRPVALGTPAPASIS